MYKEFNQEEIRHIPKLQLKLCNQATVSEFQSQEYTKPEIKIKML
jgi:hypothetical protein